MVTKERYAELLSAGPSLTALDLARRKSFLVRPKPIVLAVLGALAYWRSA